MTPASARAVRGWSVAALVYVSAVFHRTSLGVAGLLAAARFHISPAQLSVFVLLQIGVYAAMQIPTGILVDRFGPRRLLIFAATVMGSAQLLFALVPSYPAALAARALLGAGDALTFVSVLRFAADNFSPRRYPLIVSMTGMAGQIGNVAATVPLAMLLHSAGWMPSFAAAAGVSVLCAGLVWWVLPVADPVAARPRAIAAALHRIAGDVRTAWTMPGTKAGFWVHFSCMCTPTVFGVLWGVPYLVKAEGFTSNEASQVLLVSVLVAAVSSPLIGWLIGRHPAVRVPVALAVSAVTIAAWLTLVIGFGGRPPHVLIALVVCSTVVGGPASMIGFGLARDYNGPAVVGTATGVVNVGGFLATIIASTALGVVLNLAGATDASAFRLAWPVVIAVQAYGSVQALRWWLRTRLWALAAQGRGEPVPVTVVRHRFDAVVSGRSGSGWS